jgi:hypothetical protein
MIMLQRLTEFGIEAFLDELAAARDRSYYKGDWLHRPGMSDPFLPVDDEQPDLLPADKFESTRRMHAWLSGAGLLQRPDIWDDRGFWSWLAAVNMHVLTDRTGEVETITEDSSFVYLTGRSRSSWRHKLAIPVRLYDRHGDIARVSLEGNLYQHGDPLEQTISVNKILQSSAIMGVMDRLYWDSEKSQRVRGGMTGRIDQPGNIRRLKLFLAQLDLTYDLETLTTDDLMKLLPREFARFVPAAMSVA